jgi:GMP synthase-like glutamine amidotransferase
MRVLVFQHTIDEVPGSLLPWLKSRELPYTIFHTYIGEDFPSADSFDWLIVLGGPMNVDDLHLHPWLEEEKTFIRQWLKTSKPYLGICLGGQLLAQCLGAKVGKNIQREIGFWPIERHTHTHPYFANWPNSLEVLQWHEDQFELPSGCLSLFTSIACRHQAFARGNNVIGLQFHPEAEAPWILGNYDGFTKQANERYVQERGECSAKFTLLPEIEKHFHDFLDRFLEQEKNTGRARE